jgi:uncharacterized repeat protein (TIGR01451 family)
MKRLLLPISVFIAVLAAVILFQPSQALVELTDGSSSEDLRAQSALNDYNPLGLPNPAWYDLAWAVRRPITITNSGSVLTNTQVLVSLGSSFDFSNAKVNGADLRVTAVNGTTLIPFWIESWDNTGQRAWVWVKLPSLPNGNTVIYLYYGNPAAATVSDGKATFEVYDGFEDYGTGSTPKGDLTNPGEWTRYASNPVLHGTAGTWGSSGATFASMISDTTASQYRMYYHGWGTGCSGSCIGLATSTNGITWIKHAGNPVMRPGPTLTSTWDDGGVVSNIAEVSTTAVEFERANNTAAVTTTIPAAADLSVTKVDNSDPVWVGNPLSYTITVHNGGPQKSTNVSLQDTLPSGLTFVSIVPGQGSCTPGSPITCSLGNIPDGQNVTVTLYAATTIQGVFTNVVTVTSDTNDQRPGNNSDSETTTVLPFADLSVSKVGEPNPVYAGYPLTYTIAVLNNGPSSSANVTLTDILPAGVVYVSAEPDLYCNGSGPVVCNLPGLPASGSTQVQVVVRTTLEGLITNTVTVASTTYDQNLVNNTSRYVTNVAPQADLSVNKTDLPDPVYAGYPITYTVTVHNNGPSIAVNARLTDTLPGGVTPLSATPSQGSCSLGSVVTCGLGNLPAGNDAVVTIVVLTTLDGVLYNTARVASDTVDRDLVDNQDTTSTTVTPAADLGVTQVDDPDPVKASHSLTYTITVHNNGPSSSAGVTLTDFLPSGVVYVSAEPDLYCDGTGPVVCTLPGLPAFGNTQVQVVVMTTLEGLLANWVTVASTTYDRNLANNTDEEVTVVAMKADVSITQEDTPDPVIAEQELLYTLTVHNAGPSIAAFVQLTDTLPAEVTLVSVTPDQGFCNPGSVITCELGYLLSGASAKVYVVVIPQVEGSLTNIVEVSTDTYEEHLSDNTDIETTAVLPLSADLQLTLLDAPDPVMAGELLTYNAQVANLGPSRAINVSVSFDLSSEVTFMTSTPPCSDLGGMVTCSLGEIAASDSAAVTLTVQVSSSTFEAQITNDADASSQVADPSPANNHASAKTAVERSADLAIDIFDTPNPVMPGKILTYTLAYINSGPSDAINLVLTDHLPADVDYIRADPAVCYHSSGTHIVTCLPSDLKAGHSAQILLVGSVKPSAAQLLVNEVEIVSETTDPNPENNVSEETTVVDSEPPSISWVNPVGDEESYLVMIRPGLEITLTVIVMDNVKVDRVRFARWDHRANVWVPLGVFGENPSNVYEVVIAFDNYLDLPPGANGIYVFAYDTAGNSAYKRIWIVPYPNPVLLPLMVK